jgi:hypothetical protein
MHTSFHARSIEGGLHLYTQGQFWPAGIISLDEFQASFLVPDTLELNVQDQVFLKVGGLPSFPAIVQNVAGDKVRLQFLGSIHPSVIEAMELGEFDDPEKGRAVA